jgi:hypothetical protein
VTTFIEEEYEGNVRTVHLLEVLRDDIGFDALAQRVTKRLDGLKVAPYYGCLLLRPAEEMGFDDPDRPTILERFLASLGCEVVDFPHKTECCGSFVTVSSPETATECSARILETAAKLGAEMLVVSCPLCQYNLDRAQREVRAGPPRDQGACAVFLAAWLPRWVRGCISTDTPWTASPCRHGWAEKPGDGRRRRRSTADGCRTAMVRLLDGQAARCPELTIRRP